jgi:hypothetical protein
MSNASHRETLWYRSTCQRGDRVATRLSYALHRGHRVCFELAGNVFSQLYE